MRLLNMKEVCYRVGVARATIYRWKKSSTFPKPLKLSNSRRGRIAWREQDIDDWLATLPQ